MGPIERTSGANRARGTIVATIAAAAALAVTGCGSSNDTATAPTTVASATATTASDTTTASEPTSSTTTPGAEAGAATLGALSGRGSGGDGGSSARGADETTAVTEVPPDVTWADTATDYRGNDGLQVTFDCPPDGLVATVWGSGPYTDDSSVCTAAVHAGLISRVGGGTVVFEIGPGVEAYQASTANGVTSLEYGPWDGSFTFSGA